MLEKADWERSENMKVNKILSMSKNAMTDPEDIGLQYFKDPNIRY